jgi:hypothetical protein
MGERRLHGEIPAMSVWGAIASVRTQIEASPHISAAGTDASADYRVCFREPLCDIDEVTEVRNVGSGAIV